MTLEQMPRQAGFRVFSVSEPSMIAESRRCAMDLARQHNLGELKQGRVGLIVAELGTNLLKHGNGGELLVDTFDDRDGRGIEILALDKGSGITDINRALQDGYSTAGSPGTGLGAVTRLADVFALTSTPSHGTAAVARVTGPGGEPACRFAGRGLAVAHPGETSCGDAWAWRCMNDRAQVLVADGLGHGSAAAQASERAVAIFQDSACGTLEDIMTELHRGLARTRGAAVAVAEIDLARHRLAYTGIGNIVGALISGPAVQRLISLNGIVGHVASRIRAFDYAFSEPPTLLIHTDGIGTRWNLDSYPGLSAAHPSLIAGVLYRDFRRARDDAGVVAIKAET